jgi:hypothetical protein
MLLEHFVKKILNFLLDLILTITFIIDTKSFETLYLFFIYKEE